MAPPVNPYKKKPPPSSSTMIIENPYKKQRSNSASGETLVLTEAATRMTHQDKSLVPPPLIVPTRAPPVNPYKKKPLLLLPPSSGMIIGNRSHLASSAMFQQPTQTSQDESIGVPTGATTQREDLDHRSEAAWITPRKDFFLRCTNDDGHTTKSTGNNMENAAGIWPVTLANACKRGNDDHDVPMMGSCITPAMNTQICKGRF